MHVTDVQPEKAISLAPHEAAPNLKELLGFLKAIRTDFKAQNLSGKGYLVVREGVTTLYFLGTSSEFDFELSAKLIELSRPYIDQGYIDDVMILPSCTEEEMSAFFDPQQSIPIDWDLDA